jgi:hypothetical protein
MLTSVNSIQDTRTLVTRGGGFLGQHVLEVLAERGYIRVAAPLARSTT